MGILSCAHSWGFPRRWPEFNGTRNVDVQTCTRCGARRESSIQFGGLAKDTVHATGERVLAEVRA